MHEQLGKELADFFGSGLVHVCHAQLLAALAEAIASGVIHVEQAISEMAAHQHGVVTWHQLVALGLGRGAIEYRVRTGRLHRIYRGVYLVGTSLPGPFALDLGAVLACGKDAYLSHESALASRGILTAQSGDRHVTVVGREVSIKGIHPHELLYLHPSDTCTVNAIRMTSPARAILEIAGTHDPQTVADAVERAQVKKLVTYGQLHAALARAPRRPGSPVIRALLDLPAFTRSKGERLVLRLCRDAGLPRPEVNARLPGGDEVDFFWREYLVSLEFDSYEFHATRAAFERDRRRDKDRQRAGITQLRTTWWEANEKPFELVARIAEALAQSRSRATTM